MSYRKEVTAVTLGLLLISGIFYLYMMPSPSEKKFKEGVEYIRQGRSNVDMGFNHLNSQSFRRASDQFNNASKKFLKAEKVFKELSKEDSSIGNVSNDAENYAYLAYAGSKSLEAGARKFSKRGNGQPEIDKGVETLTTANEYLKEIQGFTLTRPMSSSRLKDDASPSPR